MKAPTSRYGCGNLECEACYGDEEYQEAMEQGWLALYGEDQQEQEEGWQ